MRKVLMATGLAQYVVKGFPNGALGINLRQRFVAANGLVLVAIALVAYAVVRLLHGMMMPFSSGETLSVSLNVASLPYYAGESLLRMLIALVASTIFAVLYGYVAAKSKWAGKVMVPVLDILQSVPVLGFLSVTVTAFMALFPHSLMGLELASIFAVFTGQAWNMAFSFYHSLKATSVELDEAATMFHFTGWERFWKLELPAGMVSLVWNGMMSFGGGWFFLAASESISVAGHDVMLPGLGSYMALAIQDGNMVALGYAMLAMVLLIIGVDRILWRPLVVWSQRFKTEVNPDEIIPQSYVYNVVSRSSVPAMVDRVWDRVDTVINRFIRSLYGFERQIRFVVRLAMVVAAMWLGFEDIRSAIHLAATVPTINWEYVGDIVGMGTLTLGRVILAVVLGALWTLPLGVYIGMKAGRANRWQPIVQLAASFPANILFPFVTILLLRYHISLGWGSVFLMMMGTQWYILFNVIAGAMAIPQEYKEATAVYGLTGWMKWRTLILPAIFPYLVTGMITAAGGAWNASIVAEVVTWHGQELVATGLGSFITQATAADQVRAVVLGMVIMSAMVVIINRVVWQRLYRLAQNRYRM